MRRLTRGPFLALPTAPLRRAHLHRYSALATVALVIAFVACGDPPAVDHPPPEITATVPPIPKIESTEFVTPPPMPSPQASAVHAAPPPRVRAAPPPQVQREVETKKAPD
jgi:hypothetical protein